MTICVTGTRSPVRTDTRRADGRATEGTPCTGRRNPSSQASKVSVDDSEAVRTNSGLWVPTQSSHPGRPKGGGEGERRVSGRLEEEAGARTGPLRPMVTEDPEKGSSGPTDSGLPGRGEREEEYGEPLTVGETAGGWSWDLMKRRRRHSLVNFVVLKQESVKTPACRLQPYWTGFRSVAVPTRGRPLRPPPVKDRRRSRTPDGRKEPNSGVARLEVSTVDRRRDRRVPEQETRRRIRGR